MNRVSVFSMKAALFFAVGVALARPAHATDLDWNWDIHRRKAVAYHKKRHKIVKRAPEVIRGYRNTDTDWDIYRGEERDRTGRCQLRTRGVGTQWIGTEGALAAARKDWMERVRYDHGEIFLDMHNAQREVSRCGRTSIGETMGQVMYRCEIVATPCKAPLTESKAEGK